MGCTCICPKKNVNEIDNEHIKEISKNTSI